MSTIYVQYNLVDPQWHSLIPFSLIPILWTFQLPSPSPILPPKRKMINAPFMVVNLYTHNANTMHVGFGCACVKGGGCTRWGMRPMIVQLYYLCWRWSTIAVFRGMHYTPISPKSWKSKGSKFLLHPPPLRKKSMP